MLDIVFIYQDKYVNLEGIYTFKACILYRHKES